MKCHSAESFDCRSDGVLVNLQMVTWTEYEDLSGFSEVDVVDVDVWGQPKDQSQGLLGGFCSNPGKAWLWG